MRSKAWIQGRWTALAIWLMRKLEIREMCVYSNGRVSVDSYVCLFLLPQIWNLLLLPYCFLAKGPAREPQPYKGWAITATEAALLS